MSNVNTGSYNRPEKERKPKQALMALDERYVNHKPFYDLVNAMVQVFIAHNYTSFDVLQAMELANKIAREDKIRNQP